MFPEWLSLPSLSLPRIDLFSLILGGVLGAFLGTWFDYFVKRPKLRNIGSGSGGFTTMRIQNVPGFLGLTFQESNLFGWRIHSHREFGLPVDRMPATQCTAWLFDKLTEQLACMLWWQTDDGEVVPNVTLKSGEAANLIVFSRQGAVAGRYYVWQPGNPNIPAGTVPPPEAQLEGNRDFIIQVNYADGRKKASFPVRVLKDFSGGYRYSMNGGSAGF